MLRNLCHGFQNHTGAGRICCRCGNCVCCHVVRREGVAVHLLCFIQLGRGQNTEIGFAFTEVGDQCHCTVVKQTPSLGEADIHVAVCREDRRTSHSGYIRVELHLQYLVIDRCGTFVEHRRYGHIVRVLLNDHIIAADPQRINVVDLGQETELVSAGHLAVTVNVSCHCFCHFIHFVDGPDTFSDKRIRVVKVIVFDHLLVEQDTPGCFIVHDGNIAGRKEALSVDGKFGAHLLIPPVLIELNLRNLVVVIQHIAGCQLGQRVQTVHKYIDGIITCDDELLHIVCRIQDR